MIAVFFLLSAAAAVAVNVQDGAVTPHWVVACGTSLLFSDDKKSWDAARGTCELFGGHLVDITSLQMNSCILSHYHQKGLPSNDYWHSGNDINEEGVWRYNNPGGLINWIAMWGTGPSGGRSENCLYIALTNDKYAGM